MKALIKGIKSKKSGDNRGTTMVETLVSFVVLMIVLAALYGMIRLSSNLRMRAVDTANVRAAFNAEIYKKTPSSNVKKYFYEGKSAPDKTTMFTLKLSSLTKNANLQVTETTVDRSRYSDSIRIPNTDAVGFVSSDPSIQDENLVPPKVVLFKYHK